MHFIGVYTINGSGERGDCIAVAAFPQAGYASLFLDAVRAVSDCNDRAEKPFLSDSGVPVGVGAAVIDCDKFDLFAHRPGSFVSESISYPLFAGIVLIDASCGYVFRLFDWVHRTEERAICDSDVPWLTCANDAAMELGGGC